MTSFVVECFWIGVTDDDLRRIDERAAAAVEGLDREEDHVRYHGSVLMRSSLGAAAFGFAGLIALSLASIVPTLSTWLPAGLTSVAKAVALGTTRDPELHPDRTIGISIAIIVVALALSWLRFRREEL